MKKATLVLVLLAATAFSFGCYQEQKVVPSDNATPWGFGEAVAISGNNAVVSDITADAAGNQSFIYFFRYNGSSWVEVQKVSRNPYPGVDCEVHSVDVDGDNAIIGFRGYASTSIHGFARIYKYNGVAWNQVAEFFEDEFMSEYYATSVAISGNYAVVGNPWIQRSGGVEGYKNLHGAIFVYQFNGTTWSKVQDICPAQELNDLGSHYSFGADVAINGSYLIGGAIDKQKAFIYYLNGSTHTLQAQIPNYPSNATSYGVKSLDITADYAVLNAGGVKVYNRSGSTWNLQATLTPSESRSVWPSSVAISGTRVVVGAGGYTGVNDAVFVFDFNGSAWAQSAKIDPSTPRASYNLSVDISGTTCLMGRGDAVFFFKQQ